MQQTGNEPEIIHAPHEIQEYALAYVERCRGDVLQLEREREVLLAALEQCWRLEQYELVVRLMTGLIYLTGRLGNAEVAQQLLLRGVYACERIQDQRHHAYFLTRLSGLLSSRGEYRQAQRIWHNSLERALASDQPFAPWEPFGSLVYMIDIAGKQNARAFAEKLLHARGNDDPSTTVTALFIRAFNAHFVGDLDRAYDDLSSCVQLLSALDAGTSFYKPFFEMEVQTELARVQGNYAGSRVYAEASLALAQTFCDPYTVADLLCDQIWYAHWMGKIDDAYLLMVRLIELTKQHGTPHHYAFSTLLSKQFPESLRISLTSMLTADVGVQSLGNPVRQFIEPVTEMLTADVGAQFRAPALMGLDREHAARPSQAGRDDQRDICRFSESLSRSELDVLRLLATGLSNQEIAANLVIAIGTVKKHIEHIYGKLDVHSRTQAVARARTLGLIA